MTQQVTLQLTLADETRKKRRREEKGLPRYNTVLRLSFVFVELAIPLSYPSLRLSLFRYTMYDNMILVHMINTTSTLCVQKHTRACSDDD